MKALAFLAHTAAPLSIVSLVVLCVTGGPAKAQIYEAIDATGTRHFTNLLCSLPEAARAGARVLVDAAPLSKADEDASVSAEDAPSNGTAEDVPESQRSIAEAFQAGWSGGFGAGQQAAVVPPHPPVVIVPSPPPVVVSNAPYDPAGLYYQSPYSGTITTPFDGGRSRGLTRRQQLEDRFQRW